MAFLLAVFLGFTLFGAAFFGATSAPAVLTFCHFSHPLSFFKKGIKILLVNSSFVWYSELMKKGILFLSLLLTGCTYHNPLEQADFRFQTLTVPPYVLSSWYRIGEPGKPLTIYVEEYQTPPADHVREQVVKDRGKNVAYIGRPCQYFQTAVCSKEITPAESDKIVLKGIEQLKKKAATQDVDMKGLQ